MGKYLNLLSISQVSVSKPGENVFSRTEGKLVLTVGVLQNKTTRQTDLAEPGEKAENKGIAKESNTTPR